MAGKRPPWRERLRIHWDLSLSWLVLFTAMGFAARGWVGGLATLLVFGGLAVAGRLWL